MRKATDITILLDRSASMRAVWAEMIGGINSFVEEQKTGEGDCAITFVLFDDQNKHEVVCENRNVREFENVQTGLYGPRGNTPLYDAMAEAIKCTGERLAFVPAEHRPDKVIFISVTDGEENASRMATREQVAGMITHQREVYNWEFVFLGANFDVDEAAASIGVPLMAAAAYHYSPAGVSNAFAMAASNVTRRRSGARSTMDWTAEEKTKLAADPNESK